MKCVLDCQDDETRRSLSGLLKDVSDEHLKKLRARTVRRLLADKSETSFAVTSTLGAGKKSVGSTGRRRPDEG